MDNIIVIKEGIQSFKHTFFKYFFQYLVTERLVNSYYNMILNLFLKSGTTFAVLSTDEKIPVIEERFNKSANCLGISFFRRNNTP